MKKELAAFDIHFIVDEFQSLIGGKVDKVFQPVREEVILQLHIPNSGKKLLRIMTPNFIYLSSKKPKSPQNPLGFCSFLRKYLHS